MKRIAVIGFGFMGSTHARCIMETPGLELCGIVDPRGRAALAVQSIGNLGGVALPPESLANVPFFTDLQECARVEKLDAVSVCVPFRLHFPVVEQALNLNLDVMVEKPFCSTAEQGARLVALAKARDRILMVAHVVRFTPTWMYLSTAARERRFGDLKLLVTTRMSGVPNWGEWTDPVLAAASGGSLMDLLIHDIDFSNSVLGRPNHVAVNYCAGEFWDISLGYPGGSTLVNVRGGFLHNGTPFSSDCTAMFETASIRFSTMQPDLLHIGSADGLKTLELAGDPYAAEIAYFARCLEKRQQPVRCMPEESLWAIETCLQIRGLAGKGVP